MILVSFSDQTGRLLARGSARVKLQFKFVWERFGTPEPVEGQPRLKSTESLFHESIESGK
jgi:hypothetical protein